MESLDDPNERAGGLLALRTVAEAYGGLGAIAAEAEISREALYRALSPRNRQPDATHSSRSVEGRGNAPVG